MKKVLALIICLVMVAAIAVSAISAADDYEVIDARRLQKYGQVHYYLGDAVDGAKIPDVTDGVISEGEYVVEFEYDFNNTTQFARTSSETGNFTNTEWIKGYMSHDGEKFYMAMTAKDTCYVADGDVLMVCLCLLDGGTTIDAVTRLRFDFRQTADYSDKVSVAQFWKNYDGSWAADKPIVFDDLVTDFTIVWDETAGTYSFEAAWDIAALCDTFDNDKALEDLEMYFMPLVRMKGETTEGAGDTNIEQGYLWHYLNSKADPMLQMNFAISYPEISYYMEFFPHIVHFCEKPAETTADPNATTTTTEATTLPTLPPTSPITTPAAPTDAPTDAPKADATTKAAEKEKGCGSTVALSALAIVPMLGAAVVFGKKKED